MRNISMLKGLTVVGVVLGFMVLFSSVLTAEPAAVTRQINIPESDQFIPFVITIHIGDSVKWVNNDEDDHTVVAVTQSTTTDHSECNRRIPGLQNNGNKPGEFTLTFHEAGRFIYYCRFHAALNSHHQPIAPGPDGGIQDSHGNFGTPMMGVIVVKPVGE